jgi:hypothetical protein
MIPGQVEDNLTSDHAADVVRFAGPLSKRNAIQFQRFALQTSRTLFSSALLAIAKRFACHTRLEAWSSNHV